MMRFDRPEEPEGFSDKVSIPRQQVADAVAAGEKPEFDDELWKDNKVAFAQAQHGKCGYCESRVIGPGVGDVEHFRPKSEVSELDDDPNTWGYEIPGLANVRGRSPRTLCDQGYWWLAYEWSNYLLACERCNRAWKGTLFPVLENPRSLPPAKGDVETPLLLNPFDDESPANHLQFDDLGQVEAVNGSLYGFETIRTVGLDRESLQAGRKEKAQRAHALILKLREADGADLDRVIASIVEMGDRSYDYCGMVRIIFEQQTGVEWDIIEDLQ